MFNTRHFVGCSTYPPEEVIAAQDKYTQTFFGHGIGLMIVLLVIWPFYIALSFASHEVCVPSCCGPEGVASSAEPTIAPCLRWRSESATNHLEEGVPFRTCDAKQQGLDSGGGGAFFSPAVAITCGGGGGGREVRSARETEFRQLFI